MPLSEHEQRLFEEIERSLAEDQKFASAVRASDPRYKARRRLLGAGALLVVGLGVLVFGAVSKQAITGVVGFLIMIGAAIFGLSSQRRSHEPDLRVVGGTTSRSTRRQPRRASLIDRLEDRWRNRPEGGNL